VIFLKWVAKEGAVAIMVEGQVIQEGEEGDHQVSLGPEVEEGMMDQFLDEIQFSQNQGLSRFECLVFGYKDLAV